MMKKNTLSLLMIGLLLGMLASCSNQKQEMVDNKWDCSVSCARKSEKDTYVITYSDNEFKTATGKLSFQNQNDFPITIYLFNNGGEEKFTSEIEAGGVSVFLQAQKDTTYTTGVHADVSEGTEMKLVVYDGERADVY